MTATKRAIGRGSVCASVAGGLVLGLLLVLFPTEASGNASGTVAVAQDEGADPLGLEGPVDSEDRAEAAAAWGISESEAALRLRRQRYSALFHAHALALLPDSYGGYWIDHDQGGAFRVLVADPPVDLGGGRASTPPGILDAQQKAEAITDSFASLHAGFPPPPVVGESAEHSWVELESLYQAIDAQLEIYRIAQIPIDVLRVDIPANRVEAIVATADAAAQLESLYPTSALLVQVGTLELEYTSSDNCFSRAQCVQNPFRGGLLLTIHWPAVLGGGTGYCTGAFNATNHLDNQYHLTAAHCVTDIKVRRSNGNFYGGALVDHYDQSLGGVPDEAIAFNSCGLGTPFVPSSQCRFMDAARIFMPKPTADNPYWTISRWVYRDWEGKTYQIHRRSFPDDVRPGVRICMAGWQTGYRCFDNNHRGIYWDQQAQQYRIEAVTLNHFAGSFCQTIPGDSGAPYFNDLTAFGIHSGNYSITTAGGTTAGCVGTHIRYAEEELEVWVKTD